MIRIFKHYIPTSLLVLGILEIGLIFASVEAAVHLRFLQAQIDIGPIAERLPSLLAFTAVVFVVMLALGLYQVDTARDLRMTLLRLVSCLTISALLLAVVFYAVPALAFWRSVVALAIIVVLVVIMTSRTAFAHVADMNRFKRQILVYGAGRQAKRLRDFHRSEKGKRFAIVGFIENETSEALIDGALPQSRIRNLADFARERTADEIVVALDERRGAFPVHDLLACKVKGMTVTDLASFFERERGYVDLATLQPSWLIFSDGFVGGKIYEKAAKRIFDVLVSLIVLVVCMPILIMTAIIIKLTSKGPVLYRQERTGLHDRSFNLLKFRSMRVDAEKETGPQWASQNDPRVTPIGRFIRHARIDEIPQIFNVLKGDMSFVGPRPERPYFVEQLSEKIPYYRERHNIKPGITGWAQLNFPYGASMDDARRKLEYDLYYIKNYSLFLDFLILLQTARVVLFQDGVR